MKGLVFAVALVLAAPLGAQACDGLALESGYCVESLNVGHYGGLAVNAPGVALNVGRALDLRINDRPSARRHARRAFRAPLQRNRTVVRLRIVQ